MSHGTPSASLLLVICSSLASCTGSDPRSTPATRLAQSQAIASQPQNNGSSTARGPASIVTAALRTDTLEIPQAGQFNAIIDLRIAPGWYIYAADRPSAEAMPTNIHLELPPGIESAGDGSSPEPATTGSATGEFRFVYDSNSAFTFHRPLRVVAGAPPGPRTIRCIVEYQACNRFLCHPPAQVTLETTVRVSQ